MEENTQLPVDVKKTIWSEAETYAEGKVKAINEEHFNVYNAYIEGATTYATKLHQANETIKVLEYDNNKLKGEVEGLTEAHDDHKRLVRHLDLLINGDAAAEQASLCDLVKQIESFGLPAVKNKNYKGGVWAKADTKPEHNAGVLVFIPGEDNHITSGMWDVSNQWVLLDEYRTPEEEVTHWMPLPAFPEGYTWNEIPDDLVNALKKVAKEELTTFNPELLQVIRDAEKSKEDDLKAVKEVIGGAAAAGISQDAHEKEIMMQAFDKVRQIFVGRQWIMEGRGSYPYNDDRYQQEVRYMYDEFDQVVKDTWANIKSKSADYRNAIIAEYLESAAGREDVVEFAEWAATIAFYDDGTRLWELIGEGEAINGQFRFTTKEFYQVFKQKDKR